MKQTLLFAAAALALGSGPRAAVPDEVLALYNQITLSPVNAEPFRVSQEPVFGDSPDVRLREIPGNPKGQTPAERATTLLAWTQPKPSPNGTMTVAQRAWLGSLASEHLRLTVEVKAAGAEAIPIARIDYLKDASLPNAEVRMIGRRPVICGKDPESWYLYVEDPEVAIRETKKADGSPLWSAWKAAPAVLKPGETTVFALRAGSGKPQFPPEHKKDL